MLIIIILIPFCLYQNKHLVITTYTYESEKLGADLDGYRIVQISDLHNAAFGKENKKLLETIRSCSPDIIIITGDLVDSNHTNVERAVAFVKEAELQTVLMRAQQRYPVRNQKTAVQQLLRLHRSITIMQALPEK